MTARQALLGYLIISSNATRSVHRTLDEAMYIAKKHPHVQFNFEVFVYF